MTELEQGTGLSRSSIYHLFGSKKKLFVAALDLYANEMLDPILHDMEHGSAGLDAIVGFFEAIAHHFRKDPAGAHRGCLAVNTLIEFRSHKDVPPAVSTLPSRLLSAFTRCLKAAARQRVIAPSSVERRAALLQTSTLGIWLAARLDPRVAIGECEHIASEIVSWRTRGRAPKA